jgi:basic membrane protein A
MPEECNFAKKERTMKNAKWLLVSLILFVAVSTLVFAGGAQEAEVTEDDSFKMVMVTNVSGLGDEGFNDAAWIGFTRARDELGASISVIESGEQSQYVPNLQAAAEQGYDLIVAVGFLLVDAVTEVAKQYPDSYFVMIDGQVDLPNVVSVMFKEQEAAFLSGIIAALTTETKKVGFIGGMETPPVIRFESGWRAGINTIDPSIENVISFIGSFNNPGAGKEQAMLMYKRGIDIIQGVAGMSEVGIIEAAKTMDKWVIPCDKDKTEMCEGQQLTSSIKRIDEAVLTVASDAMKGEITGGVMSLGLKEGAVGVPDSTRDVVDPEIMALIDTVIEKVASGEIVVPSNRDELAKFVAPDIM